jgi:sugar-specific transcriptional regulator TrmB
MNIKNSLLELGFSKNEAEVYLALLELGSTQAGPLVKKTKLHRMIVYNTLDKFVENGLATVVRKKNIQIFQAVNPAILVEQIQKKEALAKNLVHNLQELQQQQSEQVTVRTLVGREGFINNMKDMLESAARQKDLTMRIIGGARDKDFYNTLGDWYLEYVNLCNKLGIKKLLLAPTSFSAEFKKKFASEKNTTLHTLPDGLNSPMYTRITEEMVSFEMYQPSLVVIQIRNAVIAKNYLDSFELLWRQSSR